MCMTDAAIYDRRLFWKITTIGSNNGIVTVLSTLGMFFCTPKMVHYYCLEDRFLNRSKERNEITHLRCFNLCPKSCSLKLTVVEVYLASWLAVWPHPWRSSRINLPNYTTILMDLYQIIRFILSLCAGFDQATSYRGYAILRHDDLNWKTFQHGCQKTIWFNHVERDIQLCSSVHD